MIDYDLSAIKGVAFDVDGVLSPSTIPMSETGMPLRMVNIKDGFALQLSVKAGLKIAIITGGTAEAVKIRYNSLGITDIFQGSAHKLPVLKEWMQLHALNPEEVAFMGDDIPDIKAMEYVGLPCCPADAAPEVRMLAHYVCHANGGYGCGRELLEQILKAKGLWMNDHESFGW